MPMKQASMYSLCAYVGCLKIALSETIFTIYRLASEVVAFRQQLCESCLKVTVQGGPPLTSCSSFLAFLNVPEDLRDLIHAKELNE